MPTIAPMTPPLILSVNEIESPLMQFQSVKRSIVQEDLSDLIRLQLAFGSSL